jgi:biopolymer transport protein TolR
MSFWNRPQRTDAELNLIPMIDIMSVLVAFLLIYSMDVQVIQNTKDVEIPQSSAEMKPNQSVVVMLTRDHVFVQGEPIATIAEIRNEAVSEVESLRLVLQRPMLAGDVDADQGGAREITVVADKSLPFDVVRKVMATCTAAAYGKISLAVMEREKPVFGGSKTI